MLDILFEYTGSVATNPIVIGGGVALAFFALMCALVTICGERHREAQERYQTPLSPPMPETQPASTVDNGGNVLHFTPRREHTGIVSGDAYTFKTGGGNGAA